MRLFMRKPEVVGQMLDSAANAVAYWQAVTIAMTFAATCTRRAGFTRISIQSQLSYLLHKVSEQTMAVISYI